MKEECDGLDAIRSGTSCRTLSGAPKIRACHAIGRIRKIIIGVFMVELSFISIFTGNMDSCIAIRIAYKKNGKVFVRSGAE